ncbi:hypothetical protein BKG83_17440 [Mycobacteroides chelonae]|nr:phage Gp37/Gp68 family protein [Mycobacteroides chelonae]OHU55958.1 hypothetical protein BKG83_17440 [Mycobacteroides chelonae]
MGDKTGIEWTDATWNPITGCDKVSPGCDHCYAETLAERFRGTPGHYYERGFDVQLRRNMLDLPLSKKWAEPRRIFVNSMSDLFHNKVSYEYIAEVFAIMALAPQHTFQVLTKRHGRMRSLLNSGGFHTAVVEHMLAMTPEEQLSDVGDVLPLPNVWLGVSAEDQKRAELRIPFLMDTPAAVRFVSLEPLLARVDLWPSWLHPVMREPSPENHTLGRRIGKANGVGFIDWVIVGGESGPGARPMHPDWARSLRDQCVAAGVPLLFKQWGEWTPNIGHRYRDWANLSDPHEFVMRVGKKAAGRELDGCTWDQYPEAVAQ